MAVVTIGNFDGCHIGHQKLMSMALSLQATQTDKRVIGLSFAPRPEAFFKNIQDERLLSTPDQKARIFAEFGIAEFQNLKFDAQFARVSAVEFLNDILIKRFKCQSLVVGADFRFGHNREGDVAWLEKYIDHNSFKLHVASTLVRHGTKVSSSIIRQTLTELGDMAAIEEMLGRPYLLEGFTAKGAQLGRRIGFPTINLKTSLQILPCTGVYAGFVWLGEGKTLKHPSILKVDPKALPAVINVGVRPTVDTTSLVTVEAHVLAEKAMLNEVAMPSFEKLQSSSSDGCYGLACGFYFVEKIRSEKKFSSLEDLKHQIGLDTKAGLKILKKREQTS